MRNICINIFTPYSSPSYPQSNGQDESIVETVKHMFKNALLDCSDLNLALLHLRNIPASGHSSLWEGFYVALYKLRQQLITQTAICSSPEIEGLSVLTSRPTTTNGVHVQTHMDGYQN